MQISFPSVPVLPNYSTQVENAYNSAKAARTIYLEQAAEMTAKNVHPLYSLNRAERSQRKKQADKVKMQHLFPIGTACIQIRESYQQQQRTFNVVTKFTAAGYPVLDNGDILKFCDDNGNENGICICARTHSSNFDSMTHQYQAIQWNTPQ
tara:strand:+ start:337 stop:789 length:453 start_codon:yes stop_codon:yes gene_type:complete